MPRAIPAKATAKRRRTDPAPWDGAHPRMTMPFNLRLPEATHQKLAWLKQHLPDTSMQKIALAAIEDHVAQLLAQHYPP